MARTTSLLLLAALMISGHASAGEPLGLQEAMTMARERAREVLTARARAEAGASRVQQAKGYRLPQISLQEIWITTENPAEVFALQLNQERFSFDDFVMSDPNQPDWFDNATTRFLLTLPIYTGGELSGRIDQARLAAEAAQIQTSWVEDGAALAAAEAYIRLAQARENIALLERILETVEAHVALAAAYVDQGMLVRSELLRAQVERSRILDLLSEAQGQAEVAQANLSLRLGAELDSAWDLEPLSDPSGTTAALDSWLDTATTRGDLEAARRMLEAAEMEVKVQRSGLMPKFGLVGRYELYDDQLFGSNGRSGAVMAMASIDLFSGNRHRKAKAVAESEHEAFSQEVEQFAAGVELEVRNAHQRALTARARHQTALEAQDAATEAERITAARFEQGVVKMLDLLDATVALQEARTRELVARADSHLATLELATRSGRRPESLLEPVPSTTP